MGEKEEKGLCCREKYWKECEHEERLERCRNKIKQQFSEIEKLKKAVYQLLKHSHLGERIVVDIQRDSTQEIYTPIIQNKDEVYF